MQAAAGYPLCRPAPASCLDAPRRRPLFTSARFVYVPDPACRAADDLAEQARHPRNPKLGASIWSNRRHKAHRFHSCTRLPAVHDDAGILGDLGTDLILIERRAAILAARADPPRRECIDFMLVNRSKRRRARASQLMSAVPSMRKGEELPDLANSMENHNERARPRDPPLVSKRRSVS